MDHGAERGVIFIDDDAEAETPMPGPQSWTMELGTQARARGALPSPECCVSTLAMKETQKERESFNSCFIT